MAEIMPALLELIVGETEELELVLPMALLAIKPIYSIL
jgi:hypothetical protein